MRLVRLMTCRGPGSSEHHRPRHREPLVCTSPLFSVDERHTPNTHDVGPTSNPAIAAPARSQQPLNGLTDGIQEFCRRIITADPTRSNSKDDPCRQLPNPRRATKEPPYLAPSHHLQAANDLDPVSTEPRHRLGTVRRILRFWGGVLGEPVVWMASG